MSFQIEDAGGIGYRIELTRSLATLVELWSSHAFRANLVRTSGTALGVTESRILWELGFRGDVRLGQLAAIIGIGAPSVTKAAARLRERGLVELRADPDDGRARRLFLTEDGRAITRELYRIGDGMIAEMTRHWSSHDLATLTALMQRLTAEARTFARDLETSGEDEA